MEVIVTRDRKLGYNSPIYGTYPSPTFIGVISSIDPKYQQDIPVTVEIRAFVFFFFGLLQWCFFPYHQVNLMFFCHEKSGLNTKAEENIYKITQLITTIHSHSSSPGLSPIFHPSKNFCSLSHRIHGNGIFTYMNG